MRFVKPLFPFQPLLKPLSGYLERRLLFVPQASHIGGRAEASACSGEDREASEVDPRRVFFLAMNHVMIICGFLTDTSIDSVVG